MTSTVTSSPDDPQGSNGSVWLPIKRLEAGKQAAIAAETGIDQATLSGFLNGKAALKAHQLQDLFKALRIKCVDEESLHVLKDVFMQMSQFAGQALIKAPYLLLEDE